MSVYARAGLRRLDDQAAAAFASYGGGAIGRAEVTRASAYERSRRVIPLRCTGADSYDPDALRLGPDDTPATKFDTGTQATRRQRATGCLSRAQPPRSSRRWSPPACRGERWACGWRSACRRTRRQAMGSGAHAPAREPRLQQPSGAFPGGSGAGASRPDRGAAAQGLRPTRAASTGGSPPSGDAA